MDRVRATDQFFVYSKSNISAGDYQTLALLYQPIIGVLAFSLYCTLWNLLNRQTLLSERYLHSDLESLLGSKVGKLEEARRNLEAIGLLNAYFHDDCFAYEIRLPMSPSSFINDGVLGTYLQTCVNEKRYEKILNNFQLAPVSRDGYVNVTRSFDEIFPAIAGGKAEVGGEFSAANRAKKVQVRHHPFDFCQLAESFPEEEKVRNLITEPIKEKILRLSYVYGLDESAMHEVFAKAANDDFTLVDPAKLSAFAREWYRIHENKTTEPPANRVENLMNGQPTDPETYFSTINPRELLAQMSGGLVSEADLRIVERLVDDIRLDPSVVNVLLAYTIKINGGTMPTWAYYQKLGMAWKRNQIDTVKIAMDYVRHLQSEYEKNQDPALKRTRKGENAGKSDAKIDWLDDYLKSVQ
ncbi:MAG TPA: DnaD domain protein [Bacillota bacterium]|nr:DnaD domain protein [Bacillota bacterium]